MVSETVLVVEDEITIREILTVWLKSAGYDICVASNGLEGLKELHERRPDLVVTDILMPQMDGYEMCKLMREVSGTPILFLTGLDTQADKRQCFNLGGDDFAVKPIQMTEFLTKVYALIHHRDRSDAPSIIEPIRSRRSRPI